MNSMLPYILISLTGVLLGSISQVMLKKAALKHYDNIIKEYLNPLVIIAYIIFFGTTLLSVWAYKGMPLSLGPILETSAYLYITVFGVLIFKEKLTKRKVMAICMIIAGIAVYALG
ncbi:MAG: EamA family transporter [Oscillospiraceae bacterium]